MSKFLKHVRTGLAACVFSLSVQAFAQLQSHQEGLAGALSDGLLEPRVYKGFKSKIQQLDEKWYCDDRRYFWSVNWASEIKDVEVEFDVHNPDLTSVRVVLKDSMLKAQYFRKGGLACLWSGAEGQLSVGRINVDFSLKAVPSQDFPDLSLDGLRIEDFKLRNVEVMHLSIFSLGFKESSDGFGDWVERNLNGLIAGFLKTELKKRLDAAINKEVQRRLKEREDSLNNIQNLR